jgi:hypothetical protein
VPFPGRPTAWKPGRPIAWTRSGAEIAFALEGPDRVDLLGFTVYQSLRQARAALAAGPRSHHFGFAPANARLVGNVRGFPHSTLWRARNKGMVIVEGEALNGSIEVRSLTVVTGRRGHGDLLANIALIRAGLRHLHQVQTTG